MTDKTCQNCDHWIDRTDAVDLPIIPHCNIMEDIMIDYDKQLIKQAFVYGEASIKIEQPCKYWEAKE